VWLAELKPVAPPKVNLDTQALFEAAKSNPPATFRSGDVVLAKRADMPKDQDHAAQIILNLATIFDEADVDKDGKLTLEEWHKRCGCQLRQVGGLAYLVYTSCVCGCVCACGSICMHAQLAQDAVGLVSRD
jgi:hypothetical protein